MTFTSIFVKKQTELRGCFLVVNGIFGNYMCEFIYKLLWKLSSRLLRTMKLFKLLFFLLLFNHSFSQKINGKYKYEPKTNQKGVEFEIEILNDSTYNIKSYGKAEQSGKVKRKGKFYYLVQYDSVAKRYAENPVKITRTKMIFYGYEPKNLKKLVKGFELKKVSH
jgi:hypothetical protein